LDVFSEQLVKSKARTAVKIIIVFLFAVCAFVVLSFIMPPISVVICAGLLWLAWYVSGSQDIEYEYILTNNDFDIDKITAKRKRKRLITIKISTFTDFFKAGTAQLQNANVKVIDVSGRTGDIYIALCSHEKLGKVELRFTPGEEFIENLEKVFPRDLKLKLHREKV
jgi:capsule polysaccharide export protein KpsC/LpsZ